MFIDVIGGNSASLALYSEGRQTTLPNGHAHSIAEEGALRVQVIVGDKFSTSL